jgi:ATP-binding cassette subfamily C protein
MDNEKKTFQNISYILKYTLRLDKSIFILFGFYTIILALNPFIGLFLPKFILDEITGNQNILYILLYIFIFFISSSILGFLISYLRGKYEPRIMRLRLLFIEMFNKKVMEIDYKYLEDPDVLNNAQSSLRAVSNNTSGIEGILNHLFGIVGILLSFLGYISIMFTLNPLILLYLFFSVLLTYILAIKEKKFEYSIRNDVSHLERKSGYLLNIMGDFAYGKEIRLYKLSYWLKSKFDIIISSAINLDKKIRKKYLLISIVSILLGLIRDGVAYAYLIYSVINNNMSIGNFSLYFATIVGFNGIMTQFLNSLAEIRSQNLYINDYRKFLDIENTDLERNAETLPIQKPYSIELQNVTFKYPKTDMVVLKNISFKIESGEKLAIVGLNGSGKTTLIKLICRLYIPDEGNILLNGVNINNFSKEDYYKIFSILFQDYKLFAFSIFENTTLTQQQNNILKAKEALKLAGLTNKIETLPKGINTNLYKIFDDEGIELSGGEKQKLALARALYKNGDVIILDEPTASLDPIAESKIYENFNEMTKNKTSVYISHRLSSTKFCDKIIFLENGEIIEYGNHNELMDKKWKYAELFKVQSQYYKMDKGELEYVEEF